jgi:hypothetical protein
MILRVVVVEICCGKDRGTGAVVTETSDFWRNGTGSLTANTVYRINRTIELITNYLLPT